MREGEGLLLFLAFLLHACLFTSYGMLRPVRSMVGTLGALEWLYAYTFVFIIVAQPLYAWVASRYSRERFIPLVYGFFALNLIGFWCVWNYSTGDIQTYAQYTFFAWLSAFIMFVVSVFWGFMSDVFTPEQGLRLFGCIAAGASVGRIVGSSLTAGFASGALVGEFASVDLILVAAGFLGIAIVLAWLLARAVARGKVRARPATSKPVGGTILSGATHVGRSRYLLLVAVYIFLLTLSNTFLDFLQNNIVKGETQDVDERTTLFAVIDVFANIAPFVLQFFLTGRIIRIIGIGPALAILPMVAMGGFAGLGVSVTYVVLALVQAVVSTGRYAVAKPSREALFTVVAREDRYKAKIFIDTVVYRGGDMVNGFLFATLFGVGLSLSALAFLVVPIAAVWAFVALALGRHHARRLLAAGSM